MILSLFKIQLIWLHSFFGRYDFWGGNAALDNAATTIVLGGLDGTTKLALGGTADSLTIDNMAAYPGFYADGLGQVRGGNAGGGFVAKDGTFTISGTLIAGALHIPDENTTGASFHVDTNGDTWWGCTHDNWTSDNYNAPAFVSADGTARFNSLIIGDATDGWLVSLNTITAAGTGLIRTANANARVEFDLNGLKLITLHRFRRLRLIQTAQAGLDLREQKPYLGTNAGVVTAGGFTLNATALYTGSKTAYDDNKAGIHIGTDGIGIGDNVFTVSDAGHLIATSAYIEGELVAGEIHIPDKTTANSFHVNTAGYAWWGCNEADFNSNNTNATALIAPTGQAVFSSAFFGETTQTHGWYVNEAVLYNRGTGRIALRVTDEALSYLNLDGDGLWTSVDGTKTAEINSDGTGFFGLVGRRLLNGTTGVVKAWWLDTDNGKFSSGKGFIDSHPALEWEFLLIT